MPPALIPAPFIVKKERILTALATPSSSYADQSPKGSVDAGIRDLIDRINALDGIVTTSSCGGRISVFLEGSKSPEADHDTGAPRSDGEDGALQDALQAAVPGGKGRGGRWLFVSHDPIDLPVTTTGKIQPISTLFGLSQPRRASHDSLTSQMRFVRFQFEPMVSVRPITPCKTHATESPRPDPARHDGVPAARATHPRSSLERRLPRKRRAKPQEPRRPARVPDGRHPHVRARPGLCGRLSARARARGRALSERGRPAAPGHDPQLGGRGLPRGPGASGQRALRRERSPRAPLERQFVRPARPGGV